MKLLTALAFLLLHVQSTEAVTCTQCYNYNGQYCVNAADCVGNYCLYEEIRQYNGQVSIKKSCVPSSYYRYDDGSTSNNINQCVARSTTLARYCVKVCNDSNHCNNQCTSAIAPPIAPPLLPPIIPGQRTCYSCISYDGVDCTDNTCQGNYCLYERRLKNNQLLVRKSCLQEAVFQLDDGTSVTTIDQCEVRNSASGSQYYVKICEDRDLCNGYCSPDIGPQRQPLVTCYQCNSGTSECFTGSCQANYCVYERQMRSATGAVSYMKTCSMSGQVEYPDNSISRQINDCEYRQINDVEYQVRVCNNGNNCNIGCAGNTSPTVMCQQCSANNQDDCTGQTYCSGQACLFEKQTFESTGQSVVTKSCLENNSGLQYPDGSQYRGNGACETRSINGIRYTVRVCSSRYCNTVCSDQSIFTTTQSALVGSQSRSTYLAAAAITVFCIAF